MMAEVKAGEAFGRAEQQIADHARQQQDADQAPDLDRQRHRSCHELGLEGERQPRQRDHAEHEGRGEEQLDLGDIGQIEPVGGIDPVAQAAAYEGGEAGRMGNRLGDERDQTRARPRQPLADEPQRAVLVAGERGEAQRGQPERQRDPPGGQRSDLPAQLGVGYLLQRAVQDQGGQREQDEADRRRTILPEPGDETPPIGAHKRHRRVGHRPRHACLRRS
jgi:hypothetical protein